MTAAEERKLVLEKLEEITSKIDSLSSAMARGGEAMKLLSKAVNELKATPVAQQEIQPVSVVSRGNRPARVNKFDPNDYRHIKEEDPLADRLNDNIKPTAKGSRPSPMRTVFCQDCRNNVEVHESLARNPYNCPQIKTKDGCVNA
jgi:uncharacterized protein YlaI